MTRTNFRRTALASAAVLLLAGIVISRPASRAPAHEASVPRPAERAPRSNPQPARVERADIAESVVLPLTARMQRSEGDPAYAVTERAGEVRAAHPALPLEVSFDADGVAVTSQTASVRFDFEQVTRDGTDVLAAAASEPTASGNRVTYDRGAGIAEHWLHGEPGLEQTFTLRERPAGEGPSLELVVHVDGAAALVADHARVLVEDTSGETAFIVSELAAFDAEGRRLEARFEVRGDRFAMRVRDEGARYPIVVDPVIVPHVTLTELLARPADAFGDTVAMNGAYAIIGVPGADQSARTDIGEIIIYERIGKYLSPIAFAYSPDGQAGDHFGSAIAMTSRWAVVTSTGADIGNRPNVGTAHVYELVAGTWTHRKRLSVPNAANEIQFGYAVAIAGNTIAVSTLGGFVGNHTHAGTVYLFDAAGTSIAPIQRIPAPVPEAWGVFGASIAMADDLLVVGSPAANGVIADQGALFVYRKGAAGYALERTLFASPASAGSLFGASVGLSGTTIIAGAPYENEGRGAAYVLTRANNGWTQSKRWALTDAVPSTYFGFRLSASGTRVVLGAPGHVSGGIAAGAACVFDLASTSDLPREMLLVAGGAAGDQYGRSVAIAGQLVLSGAPLRDVGANADQGAAYVSDIMGTRWIDGPEVGVTPSNPASFGSAIAIAGDHAVVGVPRKSVNGLAAGSIYAFDRVNGVWQFASEISSPHPNAAGRFGSELAISGNLLVVGAPANDVTPFLGANVVDAGRAYVYEHDGTTWRERGALTSPTVATNASFGDSVSVDGDVVMVGEPGCDTNANDAGCVHVFTRVLGFWAATAKITPSVAKPSARFGSAVSLSAGRVAIGSPAYDDGNNGTREGAVYYFTRALLGNWTQQELIVVPEALELGTAVSLFGDVLATTAPGTVSMSQPRVGAVYVYERGVTAWVLGSSFTHPSRLANAQLGTSVHQAGDEIIFGAALTPNGADPNAGAVYIARRNGAWWSMTTQITPRVRRAGDRFGLGIGVGNGEIWIGAPGPETGAQAGAVYTYRAR